MRFIHASVGLDLLNGSSNTRLVYQVRAFTCEVSRFTSSKLGKRFIDQMTLYNA